MIRRLLLTTLASPLAFCVFTMTLGGAMDHAWQSKPAGASTNSPARATSTDHVRATLTFKRGALDKLLLAAQYASWCGGYVTIDVNDREVLVASCDR